jgi:hypothetical protein
MATLGNTQQKSGERTMTPRATVTGNSDAPSSGDPLERDGLKENILRMHELSDRLDRYFAMRTIGEAYGDD